MCTGMIMQIPKSRSQLHSIQTRSDYVLVIFENEGNLFLCPKILWWLHANLHVLKISAVMVLIPSFETFAPLYAIIPH